jgi:pimeloyl-ACP methyl ester carboxylesterase
MWLALPVRAKTNGIEIEYEAFGDPGAPVMVLIQGFAQQLLTWDPRFCMELANHGYRVVRFDNRDAGLSTRFESARPVDLGAILGGDTATLAYTIDDMADDTVGLIDVLGVASVHVVGVSMGGMIAQSLAIRHAARIQSLGSIMSTTGDRRVGQASPDVLALLGRRPPAEREAAIEQGVGFWRVIRSPGFPFDEAAVRDRVARSYDRAFYPSGVARQAAAIVSQTDRTPALRSLTVPAVVIHGAEDPLIHVSGGAATAQATPGARLVVVPGMGHDLPPGVWPLVVDALVDNARRASAGRDVEAVVRG